MSMMMNFGSQLTRWSLRTAVLIGVTASAASAEWTVINLHPATANGESRGYGVHNGQQVGYASVV